MVREVAGSGKLAKLNQSKVGFMGFSAGGHLAGHINVAWRTRTYPAVDKADTKPCRPDASIMVYPWRSVSQDPVNEPLSGASASNITSDTPPTMLVQAENDPVHVENALYYWLHLKQAKVEAELHLYPTGGHGYGRCTPHPSTGRIDDGEAMENSSGLSARPGVDQVCTWPDRAELFLQTVGIAPKTRSTPPIDAILT